MSVKFYSVLFHRLNRCLFRVSGGSHQASLVLLSLKRNFSDWHLVGALCLERKPIITQEMTPLEKKYFEYIHKLEIEKSILSDHEKRHLDDLSAAEKMKKGDIEAIDSISKQTAQDFEDASLEEYNKFKLKPRITQADVTNDQYSIQRKLDSSLVLLVKQKIGNDHRWILPQTVHEEGETLRETAERAFRNICVNPVKIQLMGNAPVGYYKYKYPKAVRGDGTCGAKVFFFKAQLLDNRLETLDIKQSDSIADHIWLTHSELKPILTPMYEKAVQSFLYPESLSVEDKTSKNCVRDEDDLIIKSSASN